MTVGKNAVLVTGATGFLGRQLCARLKREGARVVALGRHEQAGPWDSFVKVDLSAESPPDSALSGISTIYHLASRAHAVAETAVDADSYRPVIVEGTRRLLDSASRAGVDAFIYLSSVKAMGEGNPPGFPLAAMDEKWPHTPQSPYGLAKAEAEGLVRKSAVQHDVILRPVMVYGPGEKGNLPRMVEAVRKGRFPPLPEVGNKRSMIHVDDLVEYAVRAALFPIAAGKTYILSAPDALSTRELYDAVRMSLHLPAQSWSVPMTCLKAAAGGGSFFGTLFGRRMPFDLETLNKLTGSAWYSGAKAQNELGYTAEHSIKEWLCGIDPHAVSTDRLSE